MLSFSRFVFLLLISPSLSLPSISIPFMNCSASHHTVQLISFHLYQEFVYGEKYSCVVNEAKKTHMLFSHMNVKLQIQQSIPNSHPLTHITYYSHKNDFEQMNANRKRFDQREQ